MNYRLKFNQIIDEQFKLTERILVLQEANKIIDDIAITYGHKLDEAELYVDLIHNDYKRMLTDRYAEPFKTEVYRTVLVYCLEAFTNTIDTK